MVRPSRREFVAALALAPLLRAWRAGNEPIYLIAHRGGIVDADHPENSPLALEAAIARGYWMAEVDIRRTRDGRAILLHGSTFERYYGDARAVADMTWDEIRTLRSTPGDTPPMSFDEVCERSAGRIRLMLDIKGKAPDAFYLDLIAMLERYGILESTFSLNGGPLPSLSGGRVPEAANRTALREAIARGESVSMRRFLFELGSIFDADALQLCRDHDVTPVAALNVFRYASHGEAHWQAAEADAHRLLALGVRHFQIDSVYERFLTQPPN